MYETTSQKGLNIHKGAKHKKVKASKIPLTPTSNPPPVMCVRNDDSGCSNLVTNNYNELSAICIICKEFMENLAKSSPYPPELCPCCHKTADSNFTFCRECKDDLQKDGCLDSPWGIWHLDRCTGDVICINLDF